MYLFFIKKKLFYSVYRENVSFENIVRLRVPQMRLTWTAEPWEFRCNKWEEKEKEIMARTEVQKLSGIRCKAH